MIASVFGLNKENKNGGNIMKSFAKLFLWTYSLTFALNMNVLAQENPTEDKISNTSKSETTSQPPVSPKSPVIPQSQAATSETQNKQQEQQDPQEKETAKPLAKKPIAQPAAEPMDPKPTAQPAAEPMDPKPTAQPAAESMDPKPTAQPAAESMDPKPTAQPAAESMDPKPTAQPAAESMDPKPTAQPAAEPMDPKPTGKLKKKQAQEKEKVPQETPVTPPMESIEKVSVLGSRIRRLDLEGPAPVHVIDREEIEKTGHNSIGAVLRDSTVSPFGGSSSTINVRGLGAENTLVLVNGRRLPRQGSAYGNRASNVNAVPTSAVERIEVLTDGASAVYGSEALASVINIVTRKDFTGVVASAKVDVTGPRGGDTLNTSVTYGGHSARGQFTTSLEYRQSTTLFTEDLDYINPASLREINYSDNYSTPNIGKKPFENCQERDEETGLCSQYFGHISRSGGGHVLSNFTEWKYPLSSGLTLHVDALGRFTESAGYSPTFMRLTFDPTELPPWGTSLEGVQANDKLQITHRVQSLERKNSYRGYTVGLNAGVEGELLQGWSDWVWSLNNHVANYRTSTTYGSMALIDKSKEAMKNGQYNPFHSSLANDMRGMFHDPISTTNYLVNTLDFAADGSLLEVGPWILSMATGVQLGYHGYKEADDDQVVNKNTSGLGGVNGSGHRIQESAYVELGTTLSNVLETQLAARYDNYSDFGGTFNPKLALRFQPTHWLMLRGSMGTGFKAPELPDVHGGSVKGYYRVKDYLKCDQTGEDQYCRAKSVLSEGGANPNLKEETSLSYNLGVGFQFMKDLNLSVDYWKYELEDTIGSGVVDALKLEAMGGDPSKYGVHIIRDMDANPDIDKIIAPYNNIGGSRTDGIDIKAGFTFRRTFVALDYSRVLNKESRTFKELGYHSYLGEYGVPRYRYSLSVNQPLWGALEGSHIQFKRRTVGDYLTMYEDGSIPSHSQYDIFMRWKQAGVPMNGEFTFGVINVFNSQPKFDVHASPYIDTSLYRGFATYYMGYKAHF